MRPARFRPVLPGRCHPLAREVVLVVLIKLIILFLIKSIWFTAPTAPRNGAAVVGAHLFALAPSVVPAVLFLPVRSNRDDIC